MIDYIIIILGEDTVGKRLNKEMMIELQKIFGFSNQEMKIIEEKLNQKNRQEIKQINENFKRFGIDVFLDLF